MDNTLYKKSQISNNNEFLYQAPNINIIDNLLYDYEWDNEFVYQVLDIKIFDDIIYDNKLNDDIFIDIPWEDTKLSDFLEENIFNLYMIDKEAIQLFEKEEEVIKILRKFRKN